MPIDVDFANLGTESDGSPASEFCKFCYQNGTFTDPEQTLEGMINRSVDFMTRELNFSRETASKMSNDIIPLLKRWKPVT